MQKKIENTLNKAMSMVNINTKVENKIYRRGKYSFHDDNKAIIKESYLIFCRWNKT